MITQVAIYLLFCQFKDGGFDNCYKPPVCYLAGGCRSIDLSQFENMRACELKRDEFNQSLGDGASWRFACIAESRP